MLPFIQKERAIRRTFERRVCLNNRTLSLIIEVPRVVCTSPRRFCLSNTLWAVDRHGWFIGEELVELSIDTSQAIFHDSTLPLEHLLRYLWNNPYATV